MADETFNLGLPQGVSPEQAIGIDVPRQWANGVQVTFAGDVAFIVFREQLSIVESADVEPRLVHKNVTSVVVPVAVAIQLRDVLNALLPTEEAASEVVAEDGGEQPA